MIRLLKSTGNNTRNVNIIMGITQYIQVVPPDFVYNLTFVCTQLVASSLIRAPRREVLVSYGNYVVSPGLLPSTNYIPDDNCRSCSPITFNLHVCGLLCKVSRYSSCLWWSSCYSKRCSSFEGYIVRHTAPLLTCQRGSRFTYIACDITWVVNEYSSIHD